MLSFLKRDKSKAGAEPEAKPEEKKSLEEMVAAASVWRCTYSEQGVGYVLILWTDPATSGLGESAPTSEGMALMISQAFYQTNCAGVIFCPEFSICSRCGHTWRGLHDICPNCNSNKVEGLAFTGDRYGITASWDAGQLEELKARKRMEPSEL